MNQPLKWHGKQIKPVPGCIGYYACEDGTILSRWQSQGEGYGRGCKQVIGNSFRVLRGEPRKEDGRKRYTLRQDDGQYRRRYGSHFVLEAFVGPRPIGCEACHTNGDCTDDSISNLRWDTPTANKADMKRHGTQVAGETHPKAKLLDGDIPVILCLRSAGETLRRIGERFGVTEQRIHQVCKKGTR